MSSLADFARLGAAAEPAFGCREGEFLEAYEANRNEALGGLLESSAFAKYLLEFARGLEVPYEGTASELLGTLNGAVSEKERAQRGWPKAANAMSGLLRRLAPSLRSVGVQVEFAQQPGSSGRKLIRLWLQNIDADRRIDADRFDGVDRVDESQTNQNGENDIHPDVSTGEDGDRDPGSSGDNRGDDVEEGAL
jgi:hypothetical protein